MDYQFGPGPLQVDQNTIDEKIKGDIGIVENGDVATHAIAKGYYVIWKGDLYIAKTDISSGTTLSAASGGNLTAKPSGLGAEVAALNSNFTASKKTPTTSHDISELQCYKLGSFVVVCGIIKVTSDVSQWTSFMQFPSDCKPKDSNAFLQVVNANSIGTYFEVIHTTGVVQSSYGLTSGTQLKVFGVWNV